MTPLLRTSHSGLQWSLTGACGAKVSATIESGGKFTQVSGVLGGPTGKGYAVTDGFGLIDAFAAYDKLKGARRRWSRSS